MVILNYHSLTWLQGKILYKKVDASFIWFLSVLFYTFNFYIAAYLFVSKDIILLI